MTARPHPPPQNLTINLYVWNFTFHKCVPKMLSLGMENFPSLKLPRAYAE